MECQLLMGMNEVYKIITIIIIIIIIIIIKTSC